MTCPASISAVVIDPVSASGEFPGIPGWTMHAWACTHGTVIGDQEFCEQMRDAHLAREKWQLRCCLFALFCVAVVVAAVVVAYS